ncbi:MAG: hypothetical protein RBJ76_21315 [Stenomitos frigidus ULC029]
MEWLKQGDSKAPLRFLGWRDRILMRCDVVGRSQFGLKADGFEGYQPDCE